MEMIPIDFPDVTGISLLDDLSGNTKIPELIQETHACFLSLIRDIICATPEHRMSMEELTRKIYLWLANPITPLNDWYHQSENWLKLLPSAMFFLTGEFTDQPEDFVPYIEYKSHLNIYQWIGAGRDTDNHLVPLCKYWLSRRNDMGTNENSSLKKHENFGLQNTSMKVVSSDEIISPERSVTPLPPRCPTEWVVKKASSEEIEEFRKQERKRYENPHLAFTYTQNGYESVVGPVKGIYTQAPGMAKARGHNMLVPDRPNFVTILTLVRDAIARLPNGEGTRADICELLKSSQYINPNANDQILQTIVSGALDRMHTEPDPCVKYDSKRKVWIYLHRSRCEKEFEKLHHLQQSAMKVKKPIYRKNKVKSVKIIRSDTNKLSCNQSLVDTSIQNTSEKITNNNVNAKEITNKLSLIHENVLSSKEKSIVKPATISKQSIAEPHAMESRLNVPEDTLLKQPILSTQANVKKVTVAHMAKNILHSPLSIIGPTEKRKPIEIPTTIVPPLLDTNSALVIPINNQIQNKISPVQNVKVTQGSTSLVANKFVIQRECTDSSINVTKNTLLTQKFVHVSKINSSLKCNLPDPIIKKKAVPDTIVEAQSVMLTGKKFPQQTVNLQNQSTLEPLSVTKAIKIPIFSSRLPGDLNQPKMIQIRRSDLNSKNVLSNVVAQSLQSQPLKFTNLQVSNFIFL